MKVGQFKQLMKECLREVLAEEGIITENIKPKNINIHPKRNITGNPPLNLTSIPKTGDVMIDLLNETKYNTDPSEWQNFGDFTQNMAQGYNANHFRTSEPEVGTVEDMLSNQPKTNDINQVSIDVVPDYSKFMGAMKEQGQI